LGAALRPVGAAVVERDAHPDGIGTVEVPFGERSVHDGHRFSARTIPPIEVTAA
jgi:hypothetical protein